MPCNAAGTTWPLGERLFKKNPGRAVAAQTYAKPDHDEFLAKPTKFLAFRLMSSQGEAQLIYQA
jgi:hypothetical protein